MNNSAREQPPASSAQKALNTIWPFINTKKAGLFLMLGLVAIGMYFNWGWFVAIGMAPLLLAVLPCAVMCGLGLCMMPGKNGSCSKSDNPKPDQNIDPNDRT